MPFRGTRQQSRRAFRDDFQSAPLGPEWNFRRPPEQEFASLLDSPGALTLRLQPGRLSERGQYSFVGIRQRDFQFETSVDMQFRPTTEGEEAGLVVLQNDRAAYLLTLGLEGGAGSQSAVQLQVKSLLHGQWSLLAAAPVQRDTVHLKVVGDYLGYQFQYSVDGHHWLSLGPLLDSSELSPGRLPGFNYTGVNIGLYASSNGEPSTHQALFRAFRYTPRGRDRDDWFRISSQGSVPAKQ
jgi:alpha-N-arabinofuranosidase